MLKRLNEKVVSFKEKVVRLVNNETGAQTVEWVALAAIILVLLMAVGTVFGGDSSIGEAVVKKISEIIGKTKSID